MTSNSRNNNFLLIILYCTVTNCKYISIRNRSLKKNAFCHSQNSNTVHGFSQYAQYFAIPCIAYCFVFLITSKLCFRIKEPEAPENFHGEFLNNPSTTTRLLSRRLPQNKFCLSNFFRSIAHGKFWMSTIFLKRHTSNLAYELKGCLSSARIKYLARKFKRFGHFWKGEVTNQTC